MPKKRRESLPDDLWELPRQVTCFRCNKPEQAHPSFRLLLGSRHITLCPDVLSGRLERTRHLRKQTGDLIGTSPYAPGAACH